MFFKALEVKEVNEYIKKLINGDVILRNLMVKGEISNLKYHNQALFFTLTDETSCLKCIMFKEFIEDFDIKLQNGISVVATGKISVYERSGTYQLYVQKIKIDGIGALYISFDKLKEKLKNEGLFDISRKKPLPKNPKKIGVITSMKGAAVHDIISVLKRRKPSIDIIIMPILVQGNSASDEIEKALYILNERNDIDLIILGRGGGSFEDLFPFNEEKVARAISQSKIPIISAIGHETDFTISDFVSDLRAPTPSAAAELAVLDMNIYKNQLSNMKYRLQETILNIIKNKRDYIKILTEKLFRENPVRQKEEFKRRLKDLERIMYNSINSIINNKKANHIRIIDKLNSLSPLNVLKRGYTVAIDNNKKDIITSVKKIDKNDCIYVFFKDGNVKCIVDEVQYDE
ncbi:exodeoxyribonuclease VII large subunit [Aceticella autotrophica]|uniref:Exodeoxyribonuclease 7 large subunit n=1 Tax=Aceticella autotrophica TaxID=2755338 RepID=A0A975AUB1_9THEO|nr:exodeoxyribonuclease VII large subunit [Aceticella autotrophica]QSZ26506.1 exodeoxyribonuclease VII large subunit [Aceticella autotrophica]